MPPKHRRRTQNNGRAPPRLPRATATLAEYLASAPLSADAVYPILACPLTSSPPSISVPSSSLSTSATATASMADDSNTSPTSATATMDPLARKFTPIPRPPSAAPPDAPRGPRNQLPTSMPRILPNSLATEARKRHVLWSNARAGYPGWCAADNASNLVNSTSLGMSWQPNLQGLGPFTGSGTGYAPCPSPIPQPLNRLPVPGQTELHHRSSLASVTPTSKSSPNSFTTFTLPQQPSVNNNLLPSPDHKAAHERREVHGSEQSQAAAHGLSGGSPAPFPVVDSPQFPSSTLKFASRKLPPADILASIPSWQQQQYTHAHPSNMSSSTTSNMNSIANSSFSSQIQSYPPSRSQSRFAASMTSQNTTNISDPNANDTMPLHGTQSQPQDHVVDIQNQLEDGGHAHPAPGSYQGQTHAQQAQIQAQIQAHPVPGSYVGVRQPQSQQLAQASKHQAYPQQPQFPQFSTISRPSSRASTVQSYTTASTSHTKAPAAPPGLSKPNHPPLWSLALTPSTRPTQPLPPALSAALATASRTRNQKFPSVLEPKTDAVEISCPDAIAYLVSTLKSGSPQMSALSDNQLLRDRAVDVTFYDPSGTYLIPVRELILRNTTSLTSLVMELQSLLGQNIENLNRMSSRGRDLGQYLVFSVQVRIYSDPRFQSFPKISGVLDGADGNSGAAYVQWPCDGGEMELYWNTYRRVVQIGATGNGLQAMTKPMFKVRTVLKLQTSFDHMMVGGGHVFITRPSAAPQQQQVYRPTPVTQGISKMKTAADLKYDDRELLDSIMGLLDGVKNADNVSKADIISAVSNVHNAREATKMEGKTSQEHPNKMQQEYMFNSYGHNSRSFRKQGGLPEKEKPVDPTRNWGYYQRMGGNPEIHKLFDLSKSQAPFEEEDIPPPGYYDHLHDPSTIPTAEEMVPYIEIDPSVLRIPTLSPSEQMRLKKYQEEKELAISFEDDDDDEFFPAANSKVKARSTSPALASPTPINPAKRNLRLDVDSILNSVNSRKNINSSHFPNFGGLNRPTSPSPLQNMTSAHAGPRSVSIGGTSFDSLNSMATQSSGPSFYAISYAGEELQPSDYENMLSTASNQAANYYDSMSDSCFTPNSYAMAMNNVTNNAGLNLGIAKLRGVNKPPITSLSSYNEMLTAKNPNMGTLSSFGFGTQVGNSGGNTQAETYSNVGSPTTSLANYHAQRARGGGNRPGFPRARVGSQLRGESPAFKMNPKRAPAGSPSAHLGSGLATGLQKMTMDDSTGQGSESTTDVSFEGQ